MLISERHNQIILELERRGFLTKCYGGGSVQAADPGVLYRRQVMIQNSGRNISCATAASWTKPICDMGSTGQLSGVISDQPLPPEITN